MRARISVVISRSARARPRRPAAQVALQRHAARRVEPRQVELAELERAGRRTRRSRASCRMPPGTARTAPASPAATSDRTRRCRTSAGSCRSGPSAAGCRAGRRAAARPRVRCSGGRWSRPAGCRAAPTSRSASGSAALVGEAVVLQLEVERCPARRCRGRSAATCSACGRWPASSSLFVSRRQAPGEPDQALAALGQQLLVDPRPVVEALEVRVGDQTGAGSGSRARFGRGS